MCIRDRDYTVLLNELEQFSPELLDKDRVLAVTKCDLLDDELRTAIRKELPKGVETVLISSVSGFGLPELKDLLWKVLHRS